MARQPLAKLLETLMERERESTIKSGYKSFNMFERSSFHLCSIIGGSYGSGMGVVGIVGSEKVLGEETITTSLSHH